MHCTLPAAGAAVSLWFDICNLISAANSHVRALCTSIDNSPLGVAAVGFRLALALVGFGGTAVSPWFGICHLPNAVNTRVRTVEEGG